MEKRAQEYDRIEPGQILGLVEISDG
jgi:hypothetical protein